LSGIENPAEGSLNIRKLHYNKGHIILRTNITGKKEQLEKRDQTVNRFICEVIAVTYHHCLKKFKQ
jgi:hypothetical protein